MLEEIAMVRFFLVDDIVFDIFPTLKPTGGFKMPAPTTASQVSQALNAGIAAQDPPRDASRLATIPTE